MTKVTIHVLTFLIDRFLSRFVSRSNVQLSWIIVTLLSFVSYIGVLDHIFVLQNPLYIVEHSTNIK